MNKATLRIEQDDDPWSPREHDNLGTMLCFHGRYSLGDDDAADGIRTEDFDGWDEMEAYLIKERGADIILPLYLYDHSGISISTGSFSCGWDSGQVGFIYTTRAEILASFLTKRITKKIRERAISCLEGETSVYDQYLTGDIYGYIVEDADGEELDSCWGFYGRKDAAEEGAAMLATHLSD